MMSPEHTVRNVQEQLCDMLPRLRRFARTLVRDHADADDLVQIALERALARIDQWRTDARLDAWMFGIVRNAWLDEQRSRARWQRVLVPEELGEQVGDDGGEREQTRHGVMAAMAQLSEEHRSVVVLVLVEGLSYKEAAMALDIPVGTLTSRLARGRDALQALLLASGEVGR